MKKTLLIISLLGIIQFICGGQDFGMMNRYRTAKVRVTVVDSKSGAPIEFATVYLCPQGDSTITNFAMSNSNGVAVIEDVTQGKYELNSELLGYKPFKKSVDIKLTDFENEKNLGKITMEQSQEFLNAASVSATGNPIVIKKDTIVFNAGAYHTVENGMLADLLKKMPGIKIGSNGSIQVNGESIDRLTVGGKTFFQKDPGLAVKSLPAKIVDQIQVIDRTKDDAAFTGVGTKADQEKVMDIVLKNEYQKGWFGNLKSSGGTTLNGDNQPEDQSKGLFNSNAMLSHYNATDQLVLLASAKNANEPGSWSEDDDFAMEMMELAMDEMATKQGLKTTGQAGVNYNTTRLKGMETSSSLSYNYSRKNVKETSARTSFQGDLPSLFTKGSYKGIGTDHTISYSGEIKNTNKDKFLFEFRPYLMYTSQNRNSSKESTTKTGNTFDNSSVSSNSSNNKSVSTFAELEVGIKNLGKDRRSLVLCGEFMLDNDHGNSFEKSQTDYKDYQDLLNLAYKNKSYAIAPQLELSYVEPFGNLWSFQTRVAGSYSSSSMTKDAFNANDGSANSYYSSLSKNDDMNLRERVLMQYKKGETSVLFGFQVNQEQNITKASYMGKESIVGQGEWKLNWAPYADFVMKSDYTTLRFEYQGRSSAPSGSRIVPTLDISNPVQITTGNIYLKPSFSHRAMLNFNTSDPEKYSTFELFLNGSISNNPLVSASWFDNNGVRYSIPVNSTKPDANIMMFGTWNKPFGKNKNITFSLDGDISYSSNTGYQATSRLEAIDKDNFNYDSLMDWFWGDNKGDKFYSGKSGFKESSTNTLSIGMFPTLSYRLDNFSATFMGFAQNSRTKYSLDKTADMNTWDFNTTLELLANTNNGWQFNTDFGYNFYKGYSEGYGDKELIWNAGIAKDIKAFTVSLKVADILGQQKSLHRTTSAEYMEDVQRIVMGRYLLVGIVFNFGRMNASQSSRVEEALWNLSF